MKPLLSVTIWQVLIIVFLIAKDKNDGEKELFKAQPWRSADILLVICLINIFAYSSYFLSSTRFIRSFFEISRQFLFHSFILLIIIALVKIRAKQSFSILGYKKDDLKKVVGLGIATAFSIYLILNILYFAFAKYGTYAGNIIEEIKGFEKPLDYIVYMLMAVIIGPIIEESLYRGIMYAPFRKKYGPTKAIFINALLFSVGHYGVSIVPCLFAGILFSLLYEKTESIISSIVAHSINNLLAILTAFYWLRYGGHLQI